jgi:hypothetical protein
MTPTAHGDWRMLHWLVIMHEWVRQGIITCTQVDATHTNTKELRLKNAKHTRHQEKKKEVKKIHRTECIKIDIQPIWRSSTVRDRVWRFIT